MAVTTQKSTEVTNNTAVPVVLNPVDKWGGTILYYEFNHTQSGAGDANSTVDLIEVQPGTRIIPRLSHLDRTALGTGTTLDIGFTAHTQSDGTAVAAVADKFLDGLDVAAAGNAFMGTGTNAEPISHKFAEDVREGKIVIQAIALGAGIPDAAVLKGWFAVIED